MLSPLAAQKLKVFVKDRAVSLGLSGNTSANSTQLTRVSVLSR